MMSPRQRIRFFLIAAMLLGATMGAAQEDRSGGVDLPYAIPDAGQDRCFGESEPMADPAAGEAYFGQDAQYVGAGPEYRDNGDGFLDGSEAPEGPKGRR